MVSRLRVAVEPAVAYAPGTPDLRIAVSTLPLSCAEGPVIECVGNEAVLAGMLQVRVGSATTGVSSVAVVCRAQCSTTHTIRSSNWMG